MGFKFSKIKRAARHLMSYKAVRKKLGLTGGSRHFRQLKRSLKNLNSKFTPVSYADQPTSASSYEYHPRTLSQLTGGV